MEARTKALQNELQELERQIIQNSNQFSPVDDKEGDEEIYMDLLENIEKLQNQEDVQFDREKEVDNVKKKLEKKQKEESDLRETFQNFRRGILAEHSDEQKIEEMEAKEAKHLADITKGRLAFLKTKFEVMSLDKKFAEKEAYCSHVDQLGFDQLQKDNEEKKRLNLDRAREIEQFKALHKKHVDALKGKELHVAEATRKLAEKRVSLKDLDVSIEQKRKKRDQLEGKLKNCTKLDQTKIASREIVYQNYLESEKEIDSLRANIQELKKAHAALSTRS